MRNELVAVAVGALVTFAGVAHAQGAPAQGTPAQGAAAPKKAEAVKAPAVAKGKTEVTWWGHAAFVIRTPGGAVIAIDPWLTNPKAPKDTAQPEALDAILVSHGHFDHVGETKALAQKTGAKVFGSFELVNLLGLPEAQSVGANAGGTFQVKDATIHLVQAVHSSSYQSDPKGPSHYAGAPLGYVIQIEKGPTLYHAGDTGPFEGMSLIATQFKPTVAMLPIGGHFTMGPAEAAQAARLLKAQTIVPMHYGTFPLLQGNPDALKGELKKLRGAAKVMDLEPGKSTAL
ncbi:metal-dependent hydrolase [Myxococcus sp. CA051A]|uniref:metal-dependent hydrolase n=1 Tax=unclassified Myxococcus TaxID=2648731 RepID=UPI00157B494E|nr:MULTISPECIES: metal-dependent hydrolase [unclassified Myxococcus]NTX37934.1 metal-dependent hydrolase [Myxococcus sp. CA033]NTX61583.1 metal-dependent hydrolase [Myxococcus sp. CA051A]